MVVYWFSGVETTYKMTSFLFKIANSLLNLHASYRMYFVIGCNHHDSCEYYLQQNTHVYRSHLHMVAAHECQVFVL